LHFATISSVDAVDVDTIRTELHVGAITSVGSVVSFRSDAVRGGSRFRSHSREETSLGAGNSVTANRAIREVAGTCVESGSGSRSDGDGSDEACSGECGAAILGAQNWVGADTFLEVVGGRAHPHRLLEVRCGVPRASVRSERLSHDREVQELRRLREIGAIV
jgi:hypothetical protein